MSTAMNWINSGPNCDDSLEKNIKQYKTSHLVEPGPSRSSVFLDEHEDSIDNGAIGIYPMISTTSPTLGYWNVPATRHNRGCCLSFADGRVEFWHWKGPYIFAPAAGLKFSSTNSRDQDALRLQETVPLNY